MAEMQQTIELATDDLRILAYVQHMAQTAQPASAKLLFELFAQQENRRIEANGGCKAGAPKCGTCSMAKGSPGCCAVTKAK